MVHGSGLKGSWRALFNSSLVSPNTDVLQTKEQSAKHGRGTFVIALMIPTSHRGFKAGLSRRKCPKAIGSRLHRKALRHRTEANTFQSRAGDPNSEFHSAS